MSAALHQKESHEQNKDCADFLSCSSNPRRSRHSFSGLEAGLALLSERRRIKRNYVSKSRSKKESETNAR
jgi:hypothetical protein